MENQTIENEILQNESVESSVFSATLSPKDITQIMLEKKNKSEIYTRMKEADDYYECNNEEINKKTRAYFDKDGVSHENPSASNVKLKSKFLRELVQQKKDYAFAKSFKFKLSNENEEEIDLKTDDYGKCWKDFLDKSLYSLSPVLAIQAVNHGIAWGYVWIDDNGELQITDVPGNSVYPIWKDRQHTEIDRLLHHYFIEKYESMSPENIEYAEYWSEKERILYNVTERYEEEALQTDENGAIVHSHFNDGQNWDKIPFIPFKATDDEKTMLEFVKDRIDAYDLLDSESVDGLRDDLNPLLILKGITPEVSSLIEAREIAKMTRTMSLDTDGDAKYIQAETQIERYILKMDKLRHDIYKFGYGVDFEDARFVGNPNQMVIKSLYQSLDTYTNGLERHFQDFINDLKYFFDKWYELSGKGSFEECQKYKVLIQLDRDMMMNQSAQIEDAVKLVNTGISKRTQLEFNPAVQDVELELERIKEEQEEAMQQQLDMFNFQQENMMTDEEIENKKEIKNGKELQNKTSDKTSNSMDRR